LVVKNENGDVCSERVIHPQAIENAEKSMKSDDDYQKVAELFRLLGDPTRAKIIDALTAGELCVCDLASLTGAGESAMSHQLRLLRTSRLVKYRKQGRVVYYSLDDSHISDLLDTAYEHAVKERK
jgi:ArsR family transcriptional regulator, lead/cadmium/zinc/bismuth-responsive transcriptional repressor